MSNKFYRYLLIIFAVLILYIGGGYIILKSFNGWEGFLNTIYYLIVATPIFLLLFCVILVASIRDYLKEKKATNKKH